MYVLKNRQIPLNEFYDVIVCGGGPAGWIAAVSSARAGKKTALVEKYGLDAKGVYKSVKEYMA